MDNIQALKLGLDVVSMTLILENHNLNNKHMNLGLHLQLDNELLHSPQVLSVLFSIYI